MAMHRWGFMWAGQKVEEKSYIVHYILFCDEQMDLGWYLKHWHFFLIMWIQRSPLASSPPSMSGCFPEAPVATSTSSSPSIATRLMDHVDFPWWTMIQRFFECTTYKIWIYTGYIGKKLRPIQGFRRSTVVWIYGDCRIVEYRMYELILHVYAISFVNYMKYQMLFELDMKCYFLAEASRSNVTWNMTRSLLVSWHASMVGKFQLHLIPNPYSNHQMSCSEILKTSMWMYCMYMITGIPVYTCNIIWYLITLLAIICCTFMFGESFCTLCWIHDAHHRLFTLLHCGCFTKESSGKV